MKADNFFPVSYSMPHNPKVQNLRDICGGVIAVGQWVVLLCLLYDYDGAIELNNLNRRMLTRELETDDLDGFLNCCAECALIDAGFLEMGKVTSVGVCDQLEFKRQKSEAGKKGSAKRWKCANSTS